MIHVKQAGPAQDNDSRETSIFPDRRMFHVKQFLRDKHVLDSWDIRAHVSRDS